MMIRDERSRALINSDLESLNKYKVTRNQIRQFDLLRREVDNMKIELASVREILKRIEKV
jgi:hypothetical protein